MADVRLREARSSGRASRRFGRSALVVARMERSDMRELRPRMSLPLKAGYTPQLRNGADAAEAVRHCAMLSEMIFIDAAAVWLTVA